MILKVLRLINRFLVVLLLLSSALVFTIGVGSYFYKDQIIRSFLKKSHQQFNDSVQIESIQVTFLKSFPYIGLSLQKVIVKDTSSTAQQLAVMDEAYLIFNMWKLLQGQYVIKHLTLRNGKVYLTKNWEKQLRSSQQNTSKTLVPKLHNVTFSNVILAYDNQQGRHSFHALHLEASPSWTYEGLAVHVEGQMKIIGIKHQQTTFAAGLPLQVQIALNYNQGDKVWRLNCSQLKYGNSNLTLQGTWDVENKIPATLTVQGKRVALQLFMRSCPNIYYQQLKPYDLSGQLSLNLTFTKKRQRPLALHGSFMAERGTMTINTCSQPIVCNTLSATIKVPDVTKLSTAHIHIKQLVANLAKSRLTGQGTITNFEAPQLQSKWQATVDIGSLNKSFIQQPLADAAGEVVLNGHMRTYLGALLQGKAHIHNTKLTGSAQAKGIQLQWKNMQLPVEALTGRLVFQDQTWQCQDLTGNIGPGQFHFSGHIDNPLSQLFVKKPQFRTDAKVYIDYLDLENLLLDHQDQVDFHITSWWNLGVDFDVQQLHFRRFRGHNVRGNFKLNNQRLEVEQLQLSTANGKAYLNGTLDACNTPLTIHTVTRLQGVQLNKLFYMFENFNQRFLTDEHLSGEVFANIDLAMQTDRKWKVDQDQIQANIDVRLKKGMLQNFKPIQQLQQYTPKGNSLTQLRFSELQNRIKIQKRVIHIPPMAIHSNLTRIQVSGMHTFDGNIDYKLVMPLTGLKQLQKTPEHISADVLEGLNLFLTVKGHINNYKMTHDIKALQKSLKGKITQQTKTIQKLLKGQYKMQQKQKELADDYLELD